MLAREMGGRPERSELSGTGACDSVALVDRDGAIKTLAGLRLGVGVGSWLTPNVAGKLFGLDPAANPQAPYLARLFGARDVALAWGTMGTQGAAQRRWLLAGLACDVADTLAGLAGGRGGYLSTVTSGLVSGTALSAVALGAIALAGDDGASGA
jgi:hypothetical protein